MKHMTDKHFRKMFRLSRRAFAALLEKLVDEMGDVFEDTVGDLLLSPDATSI